jgi:hypothetical protein
VITNLIQENSSNMARKILEFFKHGFINMTTGATAPHQGIQGGHPLMNAGLLDRNGTHALTAQRPEPNQ